MASSQATFSHSDSMYSLDGERRELSVASNTGLTFICFAIVFSEMLAADADVVTCKPPRGVHNAELHALTEDEADLGSTLFRFDLLRRFVLSSIVWLSACA